MHKTLQLARLFSFVFHPVILPTIGVIILLKNSSFFSFFSNSDQYMVLLVIFFSTLLLPLLLLLFKKLRDSSDKPSKIKLEYSQSILLLFSAVFYYLGFYLIGKVPVFPIFRVFLITAVLLIVILAMIRLRWSISIPLAVLGSFCGICLTLGIRMHQANLASLGIFIALSGISGTLQLLLRRQTPAQIYAGFSIGFLLNMIVLFLV